MKKITTLGLALVAFTLTSFSQDNKPKVTYIVGSAKVTVWENEMDGQYGAFTGTNFKVEKVYKKDDKWETTNYFNLTELLQLRAAIDKAINEQGVQIKQRTKK